MSILPGRLQASRQWNASFLYLVLLLIPLGFFAIFFVWPVTRVVVQSLFEPSFGLSNYRQILQEPPFLAILVQTFLIAASVTAICLVLAYPLSYFITRQTGFLLKLAAGLVLLPLWTSVVIRSYAWMILFQRDGIVNQTLLGLDLVDQPVRILQTVVAVEIGMVHILLPFMILPLVASMRSVDQTLLRAGRVLGAPPISLFFRVYVPMTLPGISAGVTLVFITALGFYVTPALLGGAKGTMAAVLIEQQASTYFNWPLASALATVLMVATIVVFFVYSRLTRSGPTSILQ